MKSFCGFIFSSGKMAKNGVSVFNNSWLTEERFKNWLATVHQLLQSVNGVILL